MSYVKHHVIIDYLKNGFWIDVITDHRTQEIDRIVTNGEDDVMTVRCQTMHALLKNGTVKHIGNKSQCIDIDIQRYTINDSGR